MALDIIDTVRTQDAVYWPIIKDEVGRVLYEANGSTPRLDEPVELLAAEGNGVRWSRTSSIVAGPGGEQRESTAHVMVGIDVDELGVLFLGRLADVPQGYVDTPLELPDAFQIQRFNKVPTIEGDQSLRIAYL